jgi:curved DNA-binding protein CbpA
VNAQFQIIQSAHEILGDPQSKAKYDASAPRSRYPGASGVRGNPWSHVGEQFPAPPRRNQGGTRRTAPPPPPQTSGAQRWQSRFASGTAPTAKQTSANDPQLKKNAAKAFEHMRKNPGASGTSPTRPRPASSQPPPMPPRNEPPRTESARQRREASFGNRRTGYQPGDRSGEDEPPVTRHSYHSAAKPPRPPKEPMDPTQDQPMPDPLAQFREPTSPLDPRPSMPYAKLGGEKTRPSDGTSPARAKSAREPGHRTDHSSSDDRSSSRQNAHRSSSMPRPAGTDRLGDDLGVETGRPHSSETNADGYDRSSFKSRSNAAHMTDGSKSADDSSRPGGHAGE